MADASSVGLLGFNPYLTQEKNEILSDLPFVLFLYAALVFLGEARERDTGSPYITRGILAGVFSYLAYGTRAIGAAIILALLAYSLLRYSRMTQFVIVVVATFSILTALQLTFVSIDSDYLRLFKYKEHSPQQNVHFYAGMTAYFWDAEVGDVSDC